jgi:hypothetical protein
MSTPGALVVRPGGFGVLPGGGFAVFNSAGECPACCGDGQEYQFGDGLFGQTLAASAGGYGEEPDPPDAVDQDTYDRALADFPSGSAYDVNTGWNWMDNLTGGANKRYYLNGYALEADLDTSAMATVTAGSLTLTPTANAGNSWSGSVRFLVRVMAGAVFSSDWATAVAQGQAVGGFTTTADGTPATLPLGAGALGEISLDDYTHFLIYPDTSVDPGYPGVSQYYRRLVDFAFGLTLTGTVD